MAAMRTVGVRLRLDDSDHHRGAVRAKKDIHDLGDEGHKTKASLEELGGQMTIAGGLMVAAFGLVEFAAAKFDKQMSEVGAVAGATSDQLGDLREAAIAAGQATQFSATEAAQAEAELAKAGVSAADILGGGLSGALSLASAGTLDLATAATIAASAMNTFGLGGKDVEHIADVLAAASNKSAASVEDLGLGLQQVGLVANQVGFGLEETVGILAAFADRGLRGSDGATSLKTALLRLAAPLPEARAEMERLGISLYDATGNMVDAVTLAGQLEKGLKDLAPAERNAALQTIFGSDAIRAANVLYSEGADGIKDYIDAVNDQGAASDVAKQKLNNLSGDVEALSGSLETLFIKMSEGTTGPLRSLTQGATAGVNAFAGLPGPLQATILGITGLTGAALLGSAAFVKLRAGVLSVNEQLIAMGPAGAKAAAGLRTIGAAAGPVLLAVTAVWAGIDQMLHNDWDEQLKRLKIGSVLGNQFHVVANSVDELDAGLAKIASNGQAVDVLIALDDAARQTGLSVQEIRDLYPQLDAALSASTTMTVDEARAAQNAAAENINLGGAFGKAANEAHGLKAAFDALNGAVIGWMGAEINAESAVDGLQAALKESNGSLDVHDEKGRAARKAVLELANAAAEAAQAKYDETHSVEDANAVYQDYVNQLKQILLQSGMTQSEVDALVDSITRMPEYKNVEIDVRANVKVNSNGRLGIPIANVPVFMRQGGIVHAAQGRVQAGVAARPSVMFAEPGTGGEAFVPKNGQYGRSMQILSQAAGWYGADVVPRGGWTAASTAAPTVIVQVSPRVGADRGVMSAITDGLRFDTTSTTSDVQNNYGRRGRV